MAEGRLPFVVALALLLVLLSLGGSPRAEEAKADVPAKEAAPKSALFEDDVARVEKAHKGLVRTLAFHPREALFATGGSDRALRIWKPGAGKPVSELILPRYG